MIFIQSGIQLLQLFTFDASYKYAVSDQEEVFFSRFA